MSEAGELEGGTVDRDYDAEARTMGWHPQDEYNGDPDKWVDAKTFVVRGETQLPIIRENNRKLQTRARRAEDELADVRAKLDEVNTSLKTLRTMAEKSNEAGYQRAKAELEAQQRQAVQEGDVATYDKIGKEIQRVEATREEIVTAGAPKPVDKPNGPKSTPEFRTWFADNGDWVKADPILANYAVSAEKELRTADDPLSEGELWDKVTEMVQSRYPRRFAAATGGDLPEPTHQANGQSAQPRRAAAVLSPSGGNSQPQVRKGGIDSIADMDERKVARAAFNSIKRGIPEYTEAEYMKVYVNPNADVISDAIKRKVANGKAN